ncbi:hypothetical protein KFL_001510060 [Klebsormidium nitens]|uniref:Prolyl 4-hydroxylase alpha subunit Fe(2+) 2OG dioxygenase domain-containing protein n=1 Tax=Klebsormidium nitens TaxID=105231 RepID=A0A1Y1I0L1_KLENI|nr:hypothetical protein KFL_001510060 [Klebsormidium nitens]|eukprot:GAQ83502.1 hypothetical protein KFL_001510060 [Klebsormidium nitens]
MEALLGPQDPYREDLRSALTSVKRSGTFSCGGSLIFCSPPGLEIPGVGPIGLPLIQQQAQALASQARAGPRAAIGDHYPWGQGLQLLPTEFNLAGLGWETQVKQIVNERVKPGLRLSTSTRVVPRLNKLLLYDAGGFAKGHYWDKEKRADDSFGTLMIVLPTARAGGELVVRYWGQESTFDFARDGFYNISYAAFFANCEHEVLPVRTGFLLALIYDLVAEGFACVPQPADNNRAVRTIRELMRDWSQDSCGPQKLVIPLTHLYSDSILSFESLQGTDLATVDALLQASKVPGGQLFHPYIGLLQRGYSSFPQEKSPPMELTDVRGCEGQQEWYYRLEVNLEELIPGTAPYLSADDAEPGFLDEFNVSRKAAVVIWPHTSRWEVRSTNCAGAALAEAASLSEIVAALPRLLEAACLSTGRFSPGESQTVADLVLEHGQVYAVTELSRALKALAVHAAGRLFGQPASQLVHLVIRHGDVELAKAFLQGYVSPQYEHGVVASLAARFGWKTLGPLIVGAALRSFSPPVFERGLLLLCEIAPPQQASELHGTGTAISGSVTDSTERGFDKLFRGGESVEGHDLDQPDSERAEVSRQAMEAVVAKICGAQTPALLSFNSSETMFGPGSFQVTGQYLKVIERFGFQEYFAGRLVDVLLSEEDPLFKLGCSPPSARSSNFVSDLMATLDRLAFSSERMEAVVAQFFVTPKLHNLEVTLLPAVEQLLRYLGSRYKDSSWFLKLYWGCLDALENRCVKPPPLDVWVLPTASACACRDCKILIQFCMDPFRVELELKCPGRDSKEHLIDSVERNRMPIIITNQESALESDSAPLSCIKMGAEEDFDQRIVDLHSRMQAEYESNMSRIQYMRALIGEKCGNFWSVVDALKQEHENWDFHENLIG